MSTDKDNSRKRDEEKTARPGGGEKSGLLGRLFGRRRKPEPEPATEAAAKEQPASVSAPEKPAGEKPKAPAGPRPLKVEAGGAKPSSTPATGEGPGADNERAGVAVQETAADRPETAAEELAVKREKTAEKPDVAPPEKEAAVPAAAGKEAADVGPGVPDSTAAAAGGPDPLPAPPEEPATEPEPAGKKGLFARLKQGLAKTRNQFVGTLDNLLYGDKEIDEEFLEELEEILLTSDLGVKTSYRLFAEVEEKVSHKELENPAHLRRFLQQEIGTILKQAEAPWEIREKPYVIMTIGVNGVGKTTTIGKLASIFAKQKKKVVLGAADTFRAAAVEQLTVWAERAKVPIIKQSMGADPAAVAFDTLQSAIKREADIVIIDTAGRLHTKVNLMDELKKIRRVLDKALPGAPHEVLLVLDANTGQNAITQAQMFNEAIGVTGLVMTKLDGTAKGGVIVGVCDELKVPVRYIGIGESLRDLRPFDASDFVDALFDRN